MIDYKKLRSLIEDARKKQVIAQNALGSAMDAIEDMGVIDLSRFETKAENANNLEEAIYCYIQYGEFDVDSIIEEVKAAEKEYKV